MEVVPVRASSRVEWVRGEQQHVPGSPPASAPTSCTRSGALRRLWGRVPRVTTIHDLNYLLVPEAHFGLRGLGMRVLVPGAVRRSRRLIVDAASTRDDLRSHLHVDPAKVDVVPLAAAPPVAVRDIRGRAARAAGARRPRGHPEPGRQASAQEPHRRCSTRSRRSGRTNDRCSSPRATRRRTRTSCAGARRHSACQATCCCRPWLNGPTSRASTRSRRSWSSSRRYEGFGLPVLEAMVRGVPVVTSSVSSLPEVAGDAAVLVDPGDPRAIAAAIRGLLADPDERARLSAAGRDRAAGFTLGADGGADGGVVPARARSSG